MARSAAGGSGCRGRGACVSNTSARTPSRCSPMPALFILRDPITFGSDVVVTRFEHGGGSIRVTVVEAAQPDLGSLTLAFAENPLTLRQWTVVDQQGRRTTVSLSDLQLGVALDPRLFQYQYLFSAPNQ